MNILKIGICLTIINKNRSKAKKLPLHGRTLKTYTTKKYYFIYRSYLNKCRTLCRSSEANWLKISDMAQGSWFRPPFPFHPFFALRPGINSKRV